MAERIPDEEWTPGVGCLQPGRGLMLRVYADDGPPLELPIPWAASPDGMVTARQCDSRDRARGED